jgi:hypothetical protein
MSGNAGRIWELIFTGLLHRMTEYFRIQIPTFGEIKSVQVLSDVLKD